MSAVINTLIRSWAVPYMNTRRWIATAFSDNTASQRTLSKNGFQYKDMIPNAVDLSAKGCGIKSWIVYECIFPDGDEVGSITLQIGDMFADPLSYSGSHHGLVYICGCI